MCEWNNTKLLITQYANFYVDSCIYDFVKMLNENGYRTIASCCGHNKQPSSIAFEDGDGEEKEIRIMSFKQARKIDDLFSPIN